MKLLRLESKAYEPTGSKRRFGRVLSALAPDRSKNSCERATHLGGCQNLQGNLRLPHVLPALRRSRNMLAQTGIGSEGICAISRGIGNSVPLTRYPSSPNIGRHHYSLA
jgi:hypothetical protein